MSATMTNSGLTRRSFLKTAAATTGTAAVLGTATLGAIDTKAALAAPEERIAISGDHYAGCEACQTEVIVRDGKVIGNRRWMDDPRHNKPCLKGLVKFQRLYSEKRIKYPMKRTGERGEDKWERISWEEAIQTMTDKWNECLATCGPTGFLIVGGGGKGAGFIQTYSFTRLGNVLGCSVSGPCNDFALAMGHNKVFGPSTNTWGFPYLEFPTALKDSKTCIAWSSNKTISNPQTWRGIAEAMKSGMKLVSVDCTYTVISQKADMWVHPKPGTDTVLVFGIMQHMIANGMTDEAFLRDHTVAPVLIDQSTKRYARMSLIDPENFPQTMIVYPYGPDYPIPVEVNPILVWDADAQNIGVLDQCANPALHGTFEINGVQLRTAYDMLIDTVNEWPVDKAAQFCEVSEEEVVELAKLCYDGPVYHHFGYGAQSYNNGVQLGHAMACLGALTGNTCKPGAAINMGWLAPAFNYGYISPTGFNAVTVPQLEIPNVLETGKFMGQPWPIKMVLLQGSSMIGGGPDTKRNVACFDYVDLVVGMDFVFNDAVKYADIVLPLANYYEIEEVLFSGSWLLYMEKCIDPMWESKSDADMVRELGIAFGYKDLFDISDADLARDALNSPAMQALGISYESIKQQRAMRWLAPDYHHDLNFETDTGRMEIYVDNPQPRINYGQPYNFDKEHLPYWFPPTEAWETTEEMKKYPLVYTSERARNRYHTQDAESPWMLEIESEPVVRLNPADAAARGVGEGDYVDVFNHRGSVIARLTLSDGVRPGMVVYPKGWQKDQFAKGSDCWGDLHNGEFDPVGVNSSYYDNVCDVKKHEGVVEYERSVM